MNQAFCMDCMEYMKTVPDDYFDLAVVDPPYGLRDAGMQTGGEKGKLEHRAFKRSNIEKWDKAPEENYFLELFRVSKNQIIWGGNYFDLPPCRCFLIWDKLQPFETFSRCEFAWTSFKKPAKIFQYDNRYSGKIHPTQKPIALYDWIFERYAEKDYKIFDSHLGSGSSRISAWKHNLDFIGTEIDKQYFDLQEERFKKETAQVTWEQFDKDFFG